MPPGGQRTIGRHVVISLCAACTGCIAAVCGLMTDGTPLPRRCLHGVHRDQITDLQLSFNLCLGAACTGCIVPGHHGRAGWMALPRRCLHGVHHDWKIGCRDPEALCLGAACTGCISTHRHFGRFHRPLPRRCLHGVHLIARKFISHYLLFASALPARGASRPITITRQS